ncbi:MAG: hypothetical protein KAR24_00270 [Candidatus Pacebacteria bacterium]|nr:hypothetical protein [Candidatus Paceibacterota bacterium]
MNRARITITLKKELLKHVDGLIDGTKIKNRSHAIESLLSKNFAERKIKKAVILAGGKGAKFEGETKNVSRVLTPYKNKLFIEHIFDRLEKEGIEEVIVSAGSLGKEIKEKIGNGTKYGLAVSYLAKDAGTASVLKYLASIIDETFLMINGNVLADVDLNEMFNFHKKTGGVCTIGMISIKEPSAFGTIKLKGNQIIDFIEKPKAGKEESYLINAGIYIMEPEICQITTANCLSLEKDLFPSLAKKDNLFGYYLQGKWFHLDSLNKF